MLPKKDILFINPWIYDFTAYDFWLRPLGLLYMASLLKRYTNFRLNFIDCLDRYHPYLNKKDGLAAWERSLEINPNQPQIYKNVEAIKEKK